MRLWSQARRPLYLPDFMPVYWSIGMGTQGGLPGGPDPSLLRARFATRRVPLHPLTTPLAGPHPERIRMYQASRESDREDQTTTSTSKDFDRSIESLARTLASGAQSNPVNGTIITLFLPRQTYRATAQRPSHLWPRPGRNHAGCSDRSDIDDVGYAGSEPKCCRQSPLPPDGDQLAVIGHAPRHETYPLQYLLKCSERIE